MNRQGEQMIDPDVEAMYNDAMIVTEMRRFLRLSAITDEFGMRKTWDRIRIQMSDFLRRYAQIDLDGAHILLDVWSESGRKGKDFRALTAYLRQKLIPETEKALQTYYGDIQTREGNWFFEKTPVGYFTVRNAETGMYLHDPYDPMEEAVELAHALYRYEMEEFHFLGCGLGYLAYQVWLVSQKTVKIYIYEDDEVILQHALRMGFLGYIDSANLILMDSSDTDKMLEIFLKMSGKTSQGWYISDWKAYSYQNSRFGALIRGKDWNARYERSFEMSNLVNIRENKKIEAFRIDELLADPALAERECVVVSAGPSLDDNITFLKGSEGKRTIIAVNTVLKRFQEEAIRPDIVVMLDPLPAVRDHIRGIEWYTKEIPLVTVQTGCASFIAAYEGDIYLLPESDDPQNDWEVRGTVASLGLELAYRLKPTVIHLVGSDLAFAKGKNFAAGVAHKEDEGLTDGIEVLGVDGSMVKTKLLYDSYRRMLENQIAHHPDIRVVNRSKSGAMIKGTECI